MQGTTETGKIQLPTLETLREYDTEAVELLAADCFEILRDRGDMAPYMETDDLGAINATAYILESADDSDLEDIYYLIEDELFEREVF